MTVTSEVTIRADLMWRLIELMQAARILVDFVGPSTPQRHVKRVLESLGSPALWNDEGEA